MTTRQEDGLILGVRMIESVGTIPTDEPCVQPPPYDLTLREIAPHVSVRTDSEAVSFGPIRISSLHSCYTGESLGDK